MGVVVIGGVWTINFAYHIHWLSIPVSGFRVHTTINNYAVMIWDGTGTEMLTECPKIGFAEEIVR